MAKFTIDLLTGNQLLLTGDFNGSGGTSPSSGSTYPEVNTFNDLPSASDHSSEIYLVRSGSGVYLINRKEAGLYYSNGSTWKRLGNIPSFFNSDNFRIYDGADDSKGITFNTSNITTNNLREITIQDSGGTLAYLDNIPTEVSKLDNDANYTTNSNVFGEAQSVIYVSQTGDDSNTGLLRNQPKQTIQAAIDDAISGITVVVLDGEIYEESINNKDDVNLYAPYASLDLSMGRTLSLSKGLVKFKRIFRTSGTNIMITATDPDPLGIRGYAVLELEEISDQGEGITIQNGLNRPLDLHIKQVFVRNNNIFLKDLHDATSHTHVTFDDIYLYSSGCTGFSLENGGNILGVIQHIKELGDGIGNSVCFDIIDGEINMVSPDCRATVIANIESNGVFRFTSQRFGGEVNNNGGQYSYYTAGADGENVRLSSNLDIVLDSNTLTLPRASGNTGSVLTVGTGGLINFTTFTEPSLEWTDDDEGVTSVGDTDETIVYTVTVDEDVTSGNISYQLRYTPAYYMLATARLRRTDVNGTILNTTSFNGSGSQTLSYSLPISGGLELTSGDVLVLTIQFSAAAANTINDGGFLTVLQSGSAITTFGSITGDPLENTSLATLFDDKVEKDNFESHTGDTTIHYSMSDIDINTNQVQQNYIDRNAEPPHYTGMTTSGTSLLLYDDSASWTTDEWVDKICRIDRDGDDDDFLFAIISANTSNTLYFDDELIFEPCDSCNYSIIDTIVLDNNELNTFISLNTFNNDVGVILPSVTSEIERKYVRVRIEKGNGGDTFAPLIGRNKDYQHGDKYGVLRYDKESVTLHAHTWDVDSNNGSPSTNPHWDITNLELIQRFLSGYWESDEQVTTNSFEPYGSELALITDRTRRFLPISRSGIKYMRYQSLITKVFIVDWGATIFKDGGGAGEVEVVIGIRRYDTGDIEIQDTRTTRTRFDGGEGYQDIRLRTPIELRRNDEVVCMALRTNGNIYINNGSTLDIIEL